MKISFLIYTTIKRPNMIGYIKPRASDLCSTDQMAPTILSTLNTNLANRYVRVISFVSSAERRKDASPCANRKDAGKLAFRAHTPTLRPPNHSPSYRSGIILKSARIRAAERSISGAATGKTPRPNFDAYSIRFVLDVRTRNRRRPRANFSC